MTVFNGYNFFICMNNIIFGKKTFDLYAFNVLFIPNA